MLSYPKKYERFYTVPYVSELYKKETETLEEIIKSFTKYKLDKENENVRLLRK